VPADREEGQGFPPGYRLSKPAEYQAVFKARKVWRGRLFSLHVLARAAGAGPRLGLVVPKKILRTAVKRNRAKRLARELFRSKRGQLADLDLVVRVVAAPVATSRPAEARAWRADLVELLRRCRRAAAPAASASSAPA
jgi:ribonuclease P protein component